MKEIKIFGYIYKITNLINNKIYIGKHKYSKPELDPKYFSSGKLINKSLEKYGRENFSIEILDLCDTLAELNDREKFFIESYNSNCADIGYNLTVGGDGISDPSPEIRQINREKHLGKKQSKESNRKRSETLKKVIHTKEWVDKIRKANSRYKPTDYCIEQGKKRHKNTQWYNDGENEYMILPGTEIPANYKKGRLKNPFPNQIGIPKSKESIEKMRNKKRKMLWYNNGEIEKMFNPENIPEGFVKGRLKDPFR